LGERKLSPSLQGGAGVGEDLIGQGGRKPLPFSLLLRTL